MSTAKKISGIALAAAAAALLSTAPMTASANDMGKCVGGNSCKGLSACQTASNSCKGQNACKGQGWTEVNSKEECDTAGGKYEPKK